MPKTEQQATVGWEQADWRKLERVVFKLQKRIYQASQRGDIKAVRKLQKTLMKSWSARMLAVRRVTQDNRGKKTAGVDGVKSLTPKQRLALVNRGFNFLGFTIRQFEVGKYASKQGFKTIITPSKEAVKSHAQKIGTIIEQHKSAPKRALIAKLNPVIRGWSNYQRGQCSKETLSKCDYITYQQLRGWAVRSFPKGTGKKKIAKEWKRLGKVNWVFATNDGKYRLIRHADTKVVRHIKVDGVKSPYDGDWLYWSARKGEFPGIKKKVAELVKYQSGKCYHCGHYFSPDSLAEIHHKDGNHKNNKRENLALVHGHCHDAIHANWELSTIEDWIDEHPF